MNEIKNLFNYKYLNVIESLCHRTQTLFNHSHQLKEAGDIQKLWTYNGIVHVKFENDDELPTKLYHPDDINGYLENSVLSSVSTITSQFDDTGFYIIN